jgi:hypothetical protein
MPNIGSRVLYGPTANTVRISHKWFRDKLELSVTVLQTLELEP